MLAWLLTIPLEFRCLAIFLLGLVIGGQLNRGIYRLAWDARAIGPWSLPDPKAPVRRWWDYLPVTGWLGLRREVPIHGRGFWFRPLLIELATGIGLMLLYYWEVRGDLLPDFVALPANVQVRMHERFFSHSLLICLLIVATFIDFDEKTIPDWITVPGLLAGLVLATAWPQSALTNVIFNDPVPGAVKLGELWLSSPQAWSPRFDTNEGLTLGLCCYLGWCFAIIPKFWTLRRGLFKAVQWLWASLFRCEGWWIGPVLAVLGTPLIVWVWSQGGPPWQGLLSALAGVGFGGGLVWAVRVVGTSALGREAMGFGDVTLMAMIGAFVGWQGTLVVFFMAPFAAVVIALAQFLIVRKHEIAFGPYLALGAVYVVLRWAELWGPPGIADLFVLGWWIVGIVVVCVVLMWGMLTLWRIIREAAFGG